MASLANFTFYSRSNIDGDINTIDFECKGYTDKKDNVVWYFKNENEYKFIILKEALMVNVNDSKYYFDINKKTEALICNGGYSYKASVVTKKLEISTNEIKLNYILDFSSFQGEYEIIVKLQ